MAHRNPYIRALIPGLVLLGLFVNSANGFFPTIQREQIAGNGGVSHEAITLDLYNQLVVEFFPDIKVTTTRMTRARKTWVDANIAVDDDDATLSASHFDGENFVGGQERLIRLLDEVKSNLESSSNEAAQTALGQALHTLQDFYSHTTWVELGRTSPSPQLGRRGQTIGPVSPPLETTCTGCGPHNPADDPFGKTCQDCRNNTILSAQLTSGYYFNEDVPGPGIPIPANKCHHGGYTDNSAGAVIGFIFGPPQPGINKDSLGCGWSPHFFLHREAARLALEASKQYVRDIKAEVSEVELKRLFGIGPTLALAVDTTGSMGGIIASVRSTCISIIEERIGTADEPSSYVLSPFNDPSIGPLVVTSDLVAFENAINGLYASGGGDYPELSVGGMIAAVDALDGGSLFMFTDAAAKDEARAPELISKAIAKSINLYIFNFDGGGGAKKLKKRLDPDSDRVYGQLALATGGAYFSLPPSDVDAISGLIDTLTSANVRYVLKINDVFNITGTAGASKAYEIPVDTDMTKLTITASGPGLRMIVKTPSGAILGASDPGVIFTNLADGSYVIITDPAPGVWIVNLRGSGGTAFGLDVTCTDSLFLDSFDVVSLCGRNGHRGYKPISSAPAYDHDVGATAWIEGNFSTAVFDIRSTSGKILQTLSLSPGSGEFGSPPKNNFFGVFRFPEGSFYVYVRGLDATGQPYQRLLPSLVTTIFTNTTDTGLNDVFTYINGTDTNSTTSSTSMSSSTSTTLSTSTTRRSTTPGVVYPLPSASSSSSSSSSSSTPRTTPGTVPGAVPLPTVAGRGYHNDQQ